MKCFKISQNLNLDPSSLNFNQEEDEIIISRVGELGVLDLTSNQYKNQMRVFQERQSLPYQPIIDYNLGVIVFIDNDFVNIVNYYTFEIIKFVQFYSSSNKVKADVKYNSLTFDLYLTSNGQKQQIVAKNQDYDFAVLRVNKQYYYEFQYQTKQLIFAQTQMSASFNLIIQVLIDQIIFYDIRDGQMLSRFDDDKVYTDNAESYYLGSIQYQNKFVVLTRYHFCLFSFTYPKKSEQQISLKRQNCIASTEEGFEVNSKLNLKFSIALITSENSNIYDLNTLSPVYTVGKYCCFFGYSYSLKYGIFFGSLDMYNNPIQLQFISSKQNIVLNQILVEPNQFQYIIQLNQDFTCYTDSQGWVWFYAFQTQALVYQKRFHADITNNLFYFESSLDVFAVSQNQIYYGILDLQTKEDTQHYVLNSQSSDITDIILIDNLDLILINAKNYYYEFYQKSTGLLLYSMNKYQIFYVESFQTLIYQEYYQDPMKQFDLNSLFDFKEYSIEKNQNIIPKFFDEKNKLIYAVSLQNQIFQIDVTNHQMTNILKRLNSIISIKQICFYNIYQTSQEIIFQNIQNGNQNYQIINTNTHLLEIIALSSNQEILQNFKLILVIFPNSICSINGSFDGNNLNYSEKQCNSLVQHKINSIKLINENMIYISHANGMLSIISNNESGVSQIIAQNSCHSKKYNLHSLEIHQSSNSTRQIYYFLTYSLDRSIKIFEFIQDKINDEFQINEIYNKQFENKILKVITRNDQNYAIVALQNHRFIYKICITCIINNKDLIYQNFFLLPFSRSKFQIQFYEKQNYLLVFTNQMYLIFDYEMANPIFISTQSYIEDPICDLRILTNTQIVITTQNYVKLLTLDFEYFKYHLKGTTSQLFQQKNQNMKIFEANIETNSLDNSYTVFNLIGYDLGENNVVFYKVPIIMNMNDYTCLEVFKNPTQVMIQKKIDGFKELQNSLTNQVKNFQFQLEFTQNLLNENGSYIQTAYPLTIPNQSNNLNQNLIFTGSYIYLDKIDYTNMISYIQVIHFMNADIYIKNSVIIQGFDKVIFENCNFYLLEPDLPNQPFSIKLIQNKEISFTSINISNQQISKSFEGIYIQESFEKAEIDNLKLTNLKLYFTHPIFSFREGNNLRINKISYNNNRINNQFNSILFYIDRINQIEISNLKIEKNEKEQMSSDLNKNYLIYVTTSYKQEISNVKFYLNKNVYFYNFPNIYKYQQENVNHQINFSNSEVNFSNIQFQENNCNDQIINSPIQISQALSVQLNRFFVKNNVVKQSSIVEINQITMLLIQDSFFTQNKIQSCITALEGSQIILKNSSFTNNKSQGSGAGLNIQDFNQANSNVIQDCNFYENFSQDEGGAIYLQNVDIDIFNSKFINNTSTIGGAIRYKELIPSFVRKLNINRSLQNSFKIVFNGNSAKIFGQNIGSYPWIIVLKEDHSRDLEQLVIEDYRSGDNKYSLKLVMLDEENNIVKVDHQKNGYSLKIQNEINTYQLQLNSLNPTQLEIKENVLFFYIRNGQDYLFNLKGMQLVGIPNNKAEFQVQAHFISKIDGNSISIGQKVYTVEVQFRKCQIGEIYIKISGSIYECSPCKENFYSVQIPEKDSNQACKSCPNKGAVSCINSTINIQKGYWRDNQLSDVIISCANKPENCYGKEKDNYCAEGYIGPLCEVCDNYGQFWGQKYGLLGNQLCNECNKPGSIVLKQLLNLVFISLYLIYSIQKSIDVASKQIIYQTLRRLDILIIGKTGEKDQISFYIKLLINFIQITSIIQNQLSQFFDVTFLDVSSILGSPSSYFSNSLDCIFSQIDFIPIEYLRGIWVSIQPFFYILITVILFIFGNSTKLNQQKRRRFFYAAYVFAFITFQCNTATQLVLIMSCRKIGDIYYIKSQLNKECYTKEHLNYSLYLILPLFLFWLIVVTCLILFKIKSKKNKLTEPIQLYKYGFICGDYKTQFFYWEFLRITLRLSIVLVGNIFGEDFLILKSNFAILLIQVYNYFLVKYSPYINTKSLRIDYFFNQNISLLFILDSILFYTQNNIVYQIARVLSLFINLLCQILLFLMILSFIVNKNTKLNQFILKIPYSYLVLQKPLKNFKRFVLWKKLKNHFEKYRKQKKQNQKIKQIKDSQSQQMLANKEYLKQTQLIDFSTPKYCQRAFTNLQDSPNQIKLNTKTSSLNNSVINKNQSNRNLVSQNNKSYFQKQLQNIEQDTAQSKQQNNLDDLEKLQNEQNIDTKKEIVSINSEILSFSSLNIEENIIMNQTNYFLSKDSQQKLKNNVPKNHDKNLSKNQ